MDSLTTNMQDRWRRSLSGQRERRT